MADGLPVSDVVKVDVTLAPVAAANRPFGNILIVGDSPVLDTMERIRGYSDISGVATDFGTTAPEYRAAALYFSQSPRPDRCFIARWARTSTRGRLNGRTLTAAQQAMSNFTGITSGGFSITIDGTVRTVSTLNLSSQTNLNGVAAAIDTALGANGSCIWDGTAQRFVVFSDTNGASSTVAAVTSATPLSSALGINVADGATPVNGVVAETLLSAVATYMDRSAEWYAMTVAAAVMPADDALVDVAGLIEAATPARTLGITSQDTAILSPVSTTDIASRLKAARFRRSIVQYSGTSPYAIASFLGRALPVDFDASLTTLTMKFKQEPGVTAETLSISQVDAARAKNANLFVNYENDTTIVVEGTMADGTFWDEVHGTDWLQNDIQTEVYNLLYQSLTKIPQTEAGINQIINAVERSLVRAVENGLVAPGTWTADGFGKLRRGDYLPKGFYVYSVPLVQQSQADREARKSPPIQAAIKLGGAVHSVNVLVNVNR
jgi:hypothetical protein